MTIKTNDVVKIAWALHDKLGLQDEHVLDISNALWGIFYPERARWVKIPKRPRTKKK